MVRQSTVHFHILHIADNATRRLAALTMYQRARKLGNISSNGPEQFLNLAELQLEAYLVSINALSLIDPKSAWFVLPISAETGNEVSARNATVRLQCSNRCISAPKEAQIGQTYSAGEVLCGQARCRGRRARRHSA